MILVNFITTLKILSLGGPSSKSDDYLLNQYRTSKDQKWIAALFMRYVDMVYGVCLRYTPDAREAEDMTMEIYEKLSEKALKHQVNHARSWLYVLSKHHCLEQIRRLSGIRFQEFDPEFMQFAHSFHPEEDMESLQEQTSQMDRLDLCIQSLTPAQRRCIQLFYFENQSYAQIAESTEDKLGQVRSHIQNGRRMLKQCMERN